METFEKVTEVLSFLSKQNRGFIEDATGNIPLFLRPLLTLDTSNEERFLESERHIMKMHVTTYYE